MPDHDMVRLLRENVRRIREADVPLDGCSSWVDYATRHAHAGAVPCWQCASRERALAEMSELEAQLDIAARDCNEWRAEAIANREAIAESMIRESKLRERLESLLHAAFKAGAAWSLADHVEFKQVHPDRETWVRRALGGES